MTQSLNKKKKKKKNKKYNKGIGSKVGKFLVGDIAIEFYPDDNVELFIQIPWTSIQSIGANVSHKKVSRHFEIFTDQGKFLFASKDTGKILKIALTYIGNEKVVRLPTLVQTIL